MITLSWGFPSPEIEQQAINSLARRFGYRATVDSIETVPAVLDDAGDVVSPESTRTVQIANPQSKLEFCKRNVSGMLGGMIKEEIARDAAAQLQAQLDEAFGQTVIS